MGIGGHVVVKAGGSGLAWIGHALDPMDRKTVGGATKESKVPSVGGTMYPAFIFQGADIESVMEATFDSPVVAVGLE